jgi:hypothetical protein
MDDEPSKLQEEACGARPQGRTPLQQMFREPDLANVVGSLIEVRLVMKHFSGRGWATADSSVDSPLACVPIQCAWPNRLRKNSVDAEHMAGIFRTVLKPGSLQDAQKGCPARPQRAKWRGVRFGTLSL